MGSARAQLRPLFGSIALHVALAAVAGGLAWFGLARRPPPVHTVQAYLVRDDTVARARAEPPARTAAPPEAASPPPRTDPAANAAGEREIDARAAAEERRRAAEARAAEARAVEAAEAQRQVAAAAAARRRAEDAKRAEEAKAKAAEQARRQAEDAARKLREDELARQLAAEERREGARQAGLLDRYVADLENALVHAWNRPPGAKPGIRCTVYVTQVPGGVVTDARVGECNGDDSVRQSIVSAVYRASPLPAPPDPSLFERRLQLVFAPDDRDD